MDTANLVPFSLLISVVNLPKRLAALGLRR
jgi:hypothetical protein